MSISHCCSHTTSWQLSRVMLEIKLIENGLPRYFGNNRVVRVAAWALDGITAVVDRDVTGPFSKRGRQTKIVPAPHFTSQAPLSVTDRFSTRKPWLSIRFTTYVDNVECSTFIAGICTLQFANDYGCHYFWISILKPKNFCKYIS